MQIEYTSGNILTYTGKYIAHCVNAQGKMRSGVAKAIREAYPKCYEDYISSVLTMGKVIASDCGRHTILNIVGQKYYGYDKQVYVDYIALRKGISTINKNITEPVAFPLIGCGLAGGDWAIVSSILEEESTNFQPIVYTLNDEIVF